ncbi:MAG: hypothetical protein WCH11_06975 [Bdellovibrio sp.]
MGKFLLFIAQGFLWRQTLAEGKKKFILFYLKTVQVARKSLAGALLICFLLQLLTIGFFGAVVAAIFLLPHDLETKILILFFVFSGIFLVTFLGFLYAMSEKLWYKAARIDELFGELD